MKAEAVKTKVSRMLKDKELKTIYLRSLGTCICSIDQWNEDDTLAGKRVTVRTSENGVTCTIRTTAIHAYDGSSWSTISFEDMTGSEISIDCSKITEITF